ncbi:hypothetical protein VP01_3373g2 [Puccinia sorghi]|uniref:Uncharacterized protein n=1 Tax=Puccinia sorghi TaxID=27349 RepID=A0A0L6UWX2_9BASI|nr:hypothetical protein VP01_3373g2 [Puccinia sorghi]
MYHWLGVGQQTFAAEEYLWQDAAGEESSAANFCGAEIIPGKTLPRRNHPQKNFAAEASTASFCCRVTLWRGTSAVCPYVLKTYWPVELINKLFHAVEQDYYNPEDSLQQLLFLYLWVPLLQHSLDEWTNNYNTFKRRLDKKSMLPSRCSADWCYTYPEEQGGKNGLVPVPPEAANTLQTAFYLDGAELMRVTPPCFSEEIGKLV